MKLKTGNKALHIQLPAIGGTTFDSSSLKGKRYSYYGKDEGDHLDFEEIKRFAE